MNRYRMRSRKFWKLPRKFCEAANTPINDNAAVNEIMAMRIAIVGRTLRNESTALMSVSEPPYMFRAVTEIKPSAANTRTMRSEEHTSELQSLTNLVCRLLLEQ